MKITLDLVRQILREALGFESFTAGFITQVTEDPGHPTAGITRDGRLRYNPEFVAKHVSCKDDLFSLIFHELLHPMFGHFIHGCGEIENIAADAIINAVITNLYSDQSAHGNLFRKTHGEKGMEGLLRPGSNMANSRFCGVYEALYPMWGHSKDGITTGELITTLKILTETERVGHVLLLGTHGAPHDGNAGVSARLPEDVLVRIAEEIKRSVRESSFMQAGYSSTLLELLLEALNTHLSIRRVLLRKFATKRKVDKFKELFQTRRMSVSPLPLHPSKRDLVLLATGIYPFHFHNQLLEAGKRDQGLAIYLDVSGSVNQYLPRILRILRSLRKEITTVFQFSNKVVETSFETLLKGQVQTTYGTDFNCVARSILDKGFDKAILITDGCASLSSEHQEKLRRQRLTTLTVLFDEADSCEAFSGFGDVVQLVDICQ